MIDYLLQLFSEYRIWVAIFFLFSLIEGVADCQAEIKLNKKIFSHQRFKVGPKFLIFWVEILSFITPIIFFIDNEATVKSFLVLTFFIGLIRLVSTLMGYIWMSTRHKDNCQNLGPCHICKTKPNTTAELSAQPAHVSLFEHEKTANSS